MNNDKIKNYDNLNTDEHDVLDAFRDMKIGYDKARIELITYRINDLINSYDELKKLREDIKLNYVKVLQYINEEEFADIDIDYPKWKDVLDGEIAEWNEELELMLSFKYHFDRLLKKIDSGVFEREIIQEEQNID